jgi:hypothetical protein
MKVVGTIVVTPNAADCSDASERLIAQVYISQNKYSNTVLCTVYKNAHLNLL